MLYIPTKYFTPHEEYFNLPGFEHGQNHTVRVMFLSLLLGYYLEDMQAAKEAFCSAFIHDMARRHNGFCTMHGRWALKEKFPLFKNLFRQFCGTKDSYSKIRDATKNHCQESDIKKGHPSYVAAMILKDADALDRIRFGENNLSIRYLRFYQSKDMIEFARYLFYSTRNIHEIDLPTLFAFASLYKDRSISGALKKIWCE